MEGLLCPTVIGRERELAALAGHLAAAAGGHGLVVGLVGEAGVGKSRLAREVAAQAAAGGFRVLSGRAVPGEQPWPFRPFTEALLSSGRSGRDALTPELAGFGGQLARLVPDWGTPADGGADESPVLVGEAIVRLLRVLAADRGCLLVLEDLHWADPETVAVLSYLAGTIATERLLCLVSVRPEPRTAAGELVERIRTTRVGDLLRLPPLPAADQDRMLSACLSGDAVPADLAAFISAHSDGLPYLVEELLAGLVSSGALVRRDGRWQTGSPLTPAIPASVAQSLAGRLQALGPAGRQVLAAAAVLGRRFDWELLPGAAGMEAAAVVAVLVAAVAAQLIVVDGQTFRFRHALTREAVLAGLLPPQRRELSGTALVALRRAHPELAGDYCELAGDLAEAAGDRDTAAALAVDSSRRALHRGALASAESAAERARRLARPGTPVAQDAEEALVYALAHAGKPTLAWQHGRRLLAGFDAASVPVPRRLELLLSLARAAIATGDIAAAADMVDRARRDTAGVATDEATTARLEAVTAHIALEQDRRDDARRLATSAVDRARAAGLPAVQCEALEVLGRVAETPQDGAVWTEQAVRLAERNGLTGWRLRALQELALRDVVINGEQRLHEVRRLAADTGALVTVAQVDLLLADLALNRFDHDGCLHAAQRCVDASRRYGLASLPVALLWLAGAHALGGRQDDMEDVLAQAVALAPEDPRILADACGRVRATLWVLREDRRELRRTLDASMAFVRSAPPGRSVFSGRVMWSLLHTMDDVDRGAAVRDDIAESRWAKIPGMAPWAAAVRAVALGRGGRGAEAAELFDTADAATAGTPWRDASQYHRRLVAEAAIRDGWGDPARWLRESEAFFADRGYDRVARACRLLLRRAGAPVPRRGRGESVVPPLLRGLGITSREFDVLELIADGFTTVQIAQRLFLSPRTVEHHVASLFTRTGQHNRSQLIAFVRGQTR